MTDDVIPPSPPPADWAAHEVATVRPSVIWVSLAVLVSVLGTVSVMALAPASGWIIAAARVSSKAGHLRVVGFDGRVHLLPATCTAVQE